MSQSDRFVVHGVHGRVRMNRNWNIIGSDQAVVHITAGEVTQGASSEVSGPNGVTTQNFIYNLGDANVWVSNISPHFNNHFGGEPGGVEFILNVDFPNPLNVAVTITVEDQTPVSIEGL